MGRTVEASTEPIPVIRVSATGEPLPPEGVDQGRPGPDGTPVTAAVQAPDQVAAPSPVEQAPAEESPAGPAPAGQAPVGPAPADQAPVARDRVAPVTPQMPLGHSRRTRGKAGLRARVTRGLAAAPRLPAGPEVPERQDAGPPASPPAQDEAVAQGTAAGAAPVAPQSPAAGAEAAGQADADQAAANQAPAEQQAAEQQAAERQAAERHAQQATARRAADEAVVARAAAVLARKSSPAWTRRRVGLAAAAVLVLGGVAATFAFLGSGGQPGQRPRAVSGPTPVVANRDRAAAWVASQVSPATMVSCDPATCVLIEAHGFPASHVRTLGPGKGNPLISNVVVATPAVRRQFGARLTSVYAPCVLASFGSGNRQVDVQLVAPHGAAALRAALNADLQNRRQSGAGLSGTNRIQAPFTARNQLAAGQVDSRLMITLALMASLHPVHLVTFGDGGPDPDSAPLRSAELSLTGSAQKKAVLSFLRQQEAPYRPSVVTTKAMGGDRTLVTMEFTAPSPIGLFH